MSNTTSNTNTNTNTINNIVLYQNEDNRFRGWEGESPRYHVRLLDRGEEWETIVSHGPGEDHPEPQPGQKYYFCPADAGWVESTQVLEVFHVIG